MIMGPFCGPVVQWSSRSLHTQGVWGSNPGPATPRTQKDINGYTFVGGQNKVNRLGKGVLPSPTLVVVTNERDGPRVITEWSNPIDKSCLVYAYRVIWSTMELCRALKLPGSSVSHPLKIYFLFYKAPQCSVVLYNISIPSATTEHSLELSV